MRAITLGLLAALAFCTAPAATAEPASVVPEVPPGVTGVAFVDDPTIVDPHLMPIQSWSRLGDGKLLALHFTTGTPECYGVNARVHETAENVTVELRGGTRPDAVGRACILIALTGTLEVPLQTPVGDRQVLSVY
ncbi:hypothetical protein [Mycobacterium sp.]|uniref:hypothetical protein n=1 Tax=Mycobacterium sp. TaxID=1785 RepID=UPI002D9D9332|nr:hypothetical protein [Mycobacterium sp.]